MNYYSFAADLLRRKEYFRTGEKGRLIFEGQDCLTPQEQYLFLSLVYRKLEGERSPSEIGKLTFYFEQREGCYYIGLYSLENEKPYNRLCFASADYFGEGD